ncbi:putative RING-H2 finger protein ATL21B [Gossypium arboreum]|uniref:putative RING-H2 finger protein ATL21B n=1 Tax=Gossypium arboreum TaxID=29729 RepID=UPI0008196F40|nr:putative RING-H2 finger protein ATL21B [Gossypium arboreum]
MGDDRCQTRCGYKEINFPFQLKNRPNEYRCGYPGFDVSCNNQTDTIIAFPSSGNFTAQIIRNVEQIIEIGDPNGCLAKRLLEGFDLSGTPFQTVYLQNFTLLNCSNDVPFWYPEFVTYISCLSSENNYTVAISVDRTDLFVPFSSCLEIATVSVSSLLKWEFLTDTMWLTWNEPDCFSNLAKYFAIILAVSVFFIVGLVICISRMKCCLHKRRNTNTETFTYGSTIIQSDAVKKDLDQRVIEMYPTMVVGGSRELPDPNDAICSICLVEYQAKDTLKTIPSCMHYFHAICVDEWLKRNATCPLRREYYIIH